MAQITVTRNIKAPVEKVWEALDDFGNISKFNPNLKHSYLLDESKADTGLGACRQCDMAGSKDWVRERIIEYKPNKLLKMDIYDGTMPFKKAEGAFILEKMKDFTKVTMVMEFTPKFGPLGLLMGVMMKPMMKKMLNKLLKGCDEYVTEGKLANPPMLDEQLI